MEQLFNWPIDRLALVLALVVALILCLLGLLTLRAQVLWKLGLRNLLRRPLRAALIGFGLMLGTTVIGTAFGTGSTITYSLQALVSGSLGTVDEVVIKNPPRMRGLAALRTFTQPGFGALASANLQFFAETERDQLVAASPNGAIAAILPSIISQATVVHPRSQQLQLLPLLSIPQPDPVFGTLMGLDGQPVLLDTLPTDTVVLNQASAAVFEAAAGDELTLIFGTVNWSVRISAVINNGGLGGQQPLVIIPLRTFQERMYHQGEINQLLVVNAGGTASVARSAEATQQLRVRLVDRDAAQRLHDLLAQPQIQRGLRNLEANLRPQDRDRVVALRTAAAEPALTDTFISLISDPRIRGRLGSLSRRFPDPEVRTTVPGLLERVASLSVLPLKQEALDQANEYGAVITTVFLVLGLFSLAAALLLLFLIFALLAADRSVELATMRALGMRRRQIMHMFLLEGTIYNLAGALLGTLVSIGIAYGLSRALGQGFKPFGIAVVPYVDPRSLVITLCAGMLLIFAAMFFAVRRISRLELIAATRGLQRSGKPRWLSLATGLWLGTAVWLLLGPDQHPLLIPLGLSLFVLGCTCALRALLDQRQSSQPSLINNLSALTGVAVSAIWLWSLAQLPNPAATTRNNAITLVVAGCMLLPVAVWTVTQGLGPALKLLDRSLGGLPRVRAVVRPAAGYLAHDRWRTALTVIMFGMVMLLIVLALVLINTVATAYAPTEAPVAGFELRADVQNDTFRDLDAALSSATAVGRDTFSAIGSLREQEVQAIQFGLSQASWQTAPLVVVDDGFLAGIRASFEFRAAEYADAAAVWNAVRTQPGTAVVTAGMLRNGLSLPPNASGDLLGQFTVWVRAAANEPPIKLRVVGVVASRAELDEGIYTSAATTTGLTLPAPRSYFFAVRPDVRLENAAAGLRVSLGAQGLTITTLGELLRIANAVRLVLIQVVQGFMSLGLIAGVAALGLLAVQAVIERRQQLGMLRAIGFTRQQTRTLLLFESAVIALLGLILGLVLGLVLARSLISILANAYPEVRLVVPWGQIAVIAALACGCSAIAITLATWEAGRIAPAEALRSV